tara:strand:+ start:280 stop:543 length:264 start_codon:yes stop_codon:yes gene_type:complete
MDSKKAKSLWLNILEYYIRNGTLKKDLFYQRLVRLRFKANGNVRQGTNKHNGHFRADRNYLWVKKHFPSLLNIYEEKLESFNAEISL